MSITTMRECIEKAVQYESPIPEVMIRKVAGTREYHASLANYQYIGVGPTPVDALQELYEFMKGLDLAEM